jgi:hypothetical protein
MIQTYFFIIILNLNSTQYYLMAIIKKNLNLMKIKFNLYTLIYINNIKVIKSKKFFIFLFK